MAYTFPSYNNRNGKANKTRVKNGKVRNEKTDASPPFFGRKFAGMQTRWPPGSRRTGGGFNAARA